ncbi:hypothetical protein [Nocardioides sp. R-C-SC26]|uniref:hypothetical protein n=1 Tax=Nocardioides sp. R-C-SC26 TaxID=2870414 RepID=UPI001E5CE6B0|nr:hypothetical protein [Nocardioides sp. R-C-SC26]
MSEFIAISAASTIVALALFKFALATIALRGVEPARRAEVIRALAQLLRAWR